MSSQPPLRVATTGTPARIASITASGKGSATDGSTSTSETARISGTSDRLPNSRTVVSSPSE